MSTREKAVARRVVAVAQALPALAELLTPLRPEPDLPLARLGLVPSLPSALTRLSSLPLLLLFSPQLLDS